MRTKDLRASSTTPLSTFRGAALRHRVQDERRNSVAIERGQLLHEGGWPAM